MPLAVGAHRQDGSSRCPGVCDQYDFQDFQCVRHAGSLFAFFGFS